MKKLPALFAIVVLHHPSNPMRFTLLGNNTMNRIKISIHPFFSFFGLIFFFGTVVDQKKHNMDSEYSLFGFSAGKANNGQPDFD